MRYGTEEQKNYFLPKVTSNFTCTFLNFFLNRDTHSITTTECPAQLAVGDLVPCFGLTAPHSGSDAASMSEAYGIFPPSLSFYFLPSILYSLIYVLYPILYLMCPHTAYDPE